MMPVRSVIDMTFGAVPIEFIDNRPPNCPACRKHIEVVGLECTYCSHVFSDADKKNMAAEAKIFYRNVKLSTTAFVVLLLLLTLVFSVGFG